MTVLPISLPNSFGITQLPLAGLNPPIFFHIALFPHLFLH
jgi:hypothetical protein